MTNRRQFIPLAGLAGTLGMAVYMVAQLNGQAGTVAPQDFRGAAAAEIRDSAGQVVLQGQFAEAADEQDDDLERKAVLAPLVAGGAAKGEAEVEIDRDTPAAQEVEFSASGVTPGAVFTFLIDGQAIGTATATAKGKVSLDVDVALPAAATAR